MKDDTNPPQTVEETDSGCTPAEVKHSIFSDADELYRFIANHESPTTNLMLSLHVALVQLLLTCKEIEEGSDDIDVNIDALGRLVSDSMVLQARLGQMRHLLAQLVDQRLTGLSGTEAQNRELYRRLEYLLRDYAAPED